MKLLTLARDLQRRKAREKHSLFVAEGVRSVEELLRSGVAIRGALVTPKLTAAPRPVRLFVGLVAHGTVAVARAVLGDAYRSIDRVGAIDEKDGQRLREQGVRPERIGVTGDTRYDQVWSRARRKNICTRLPTTAM